MSVGRWPALGRDNGFMSNYKDTSKQKKKKLQGKGVGNDELFDPAF
jgi:hypothetical protein